MADFSCLTLDTDAPVAHMRLTRPDLHNRFDEPLHAEFPQALVAVARLPDVAALVISAEGKSFSAGGDLEMMLRANASASVRQRIIAEGLAIIDGLLALPCPVIVALQGSAIGLGATIMACCDIVVAWRGARIADPHVVLGLVAGDGGVMGWSQSMGIMRAKRYLLTGEAITAEQAHAFGMVSDLVDSPAEALPAARAIAERIAALPRGGVRGTRRAFSRLTKDLYAGAFELSLALEAETLGGAEVLAAVTAARSRR
jgi:enoyl-CoA hydratase